MRKMHIRSEVELRDTIEVAIALNGVSVGDDVGGQLGRQCVPVHHDGAEEVWHEDAISRFQLLVEVVVAGRAWR
jgi:hypothetical protein